MTALRKWSLVVALSLILTAFLVLRQHSEVGEKPRPRTSGTIPSVYHSARAAGATLEGDSAAEVVKQLLGGVKGTGSFSEITFRAPQLSSEELDVVLRDLTLVDGILTHITAGDDPP